LITTSSNASSPERYYHSENKGFHLKYQANSLKTRRVLSFLTLAENILRFNPLIRKSPDIS
ncbi:TPA: hypothetical protein N7L91_004217, partial [Escherichia coli]|nr:hypothetical protein [Escherichia coli]HAN6566734.1 hypothetical protein [Escherichia coli]HCO1470275.1 hypothetical protein [Escherichia coli]HCO1474721.1 hypothetical protein [Escherichia coli]